MTERLHQEAVQHAAAVSEVRQELDESQERLRLVEAGKAQLVAASKSKNEQVGALPCSCLWRDVLSEVGGFPAGSALG